MITKHKYVKAIGLNVAYDKLAHEIAAAKIKAFATVADAVPPGMPVCFIWREINRIVPGVIEGTKVREIGADTYISAQPFTPEQIAAIMRPDTFRAEGVTDAPAPEATLAPEAEGFSLDLREGGS